MNGRIDDQHRALIDLAVRRSSDATPFQITAWIDTAFNGHLVFPIGLIAQLQLDSLPVETDAILADGKKVKLNAFYCYLDWQGKTIPVHVIANEGKLPLLGTELLKSTVLHIDYQAKTLTVD